MERLRISGSLIVAVIACGLFVTFVLAYIFLKEYSATRKSRTIEIGDTFVIERVSENPFEDCYIFGGYVIGKYGNYIQYVDSRSGDTCTVDIRSAYLFPRTLKVTVIKNDDRSFKNKVAYDKRRKNLINR